MKIKTWVMMAMVGVATHVQLYAEETPTLTLENTKGSKIEAVILASDNTTVTFKRVGKEKVYTLRLDQLTEATQDSLLAYDLPVKVEEPEKGDVISVPKESFLPIKFSSGKTSKRTNRGTYDDERTDTLKPVVTIENRDSKTPLSCGMTVVVFGRGVVEKRTIKVLAKKSFTLNQAGGAKSTYSLEEFSFKYDARDYYNYGFKYQGYAVVLHDKDGEPLRVIASPSGYKSIPRRALKVVKGKVYDSELIKEIKPPQR
ncbi:MAG: hypothetical protein L7V86_21050 [Verrucomicrobiales bacterium]|jgi:hypothetical protein|nr:hypothetical protein [Verrucomicrobiales bacterium]MDB4526996.1 hypothetical protein [bacterium]MDF1786784.1 hypothetical protein [Verrucomicrobiales bacterium]